jgi:DNA-binding NarL/FixJ family response regulator
MMKKKISVLLIDDHPIICDVYTIALKLVEKSEGVSFKIEVANTIDKALARLAKIQGQKSQIDLIVLDIKLPPSKDKKILTGEELGIKINELLPEVTLIVSTTYNDNYRIYSLLKELNPAGLLIKNDITTEELVHAFKRVLTDPPYYSSSVTQSMRNEVLNDISIDHKDRRILYELSIGTKTKDLPNILPISLAGIEKRKRNLKGIFDVKGQDDKKLIQKAKEKGFI